MGCVCKKLERPGQKERPQNAAVARFLSYQGQTRDKVADALPTRRDAERMKKGTNNDHKKKGYMRFLRYWILPHVARARITPDVEVEKRREVSAALVRMCACAIDCLHHYESAYRIANVGAASQAGRPPLRQLYHPI